MRNKLHVVFGESARKVLLATSEYTNSPVIAMNDDLMAGPVSASDQQEMARQRVEWFQENIPCPETIERLTQSVNEDLRKITFIQEVMSAEYELYIWSGRTTHDKIRAARLASKLKDVQNTFLLDIPDVKIKSITGRDFTPVSLVVMHPSQVSYLNEHFKPLSAVIRSIWTDLWERLKKDSSHLRVRVNEQLTGVRVSYFDEALLDRCTNKFQSSARVIGYCLMDIDFEVNDYILNWRLTELVKAEKLESRGDLKCMRHYEVRLVKSDTGHVARRGLLSRDL